MSATDPLVIRVWHQDGWWWVQTHHTAGSLPGDAVPHRTRDEAVEAAEQRRLRRFAIDKSRPCTVEVTE